MFYYYYPRLKVFMPFNGCRQGQFFSFVSVSTKTFPASGGEALENRQRQSLADDKQIPLPNNKRGWY